MSVIRKIFNNKLWLPIALVLLVLVNWLASQWHTRIDLTNEKRFTLSKSTKKVLKGLDSTVEITVLLAGDIKSEFKKLAVSTQEMLETFKDVNPANIQYKFQLPAGGLDDSAKAIVYDSLIRMGLRPTNQQVQSKEGEGKNQQQIFPGAVISYAGRTIAIDLLQGQVQKNVFNSGDLLDKESLNSAEALLEYKFANAIQKLTEKEIPVIAYAYGNGEPPFGWPNSNDVFKTLGQNFIADTVNIKNVPFIPNEFNVLLFVKPVFKFTDDDKFKIDQYVMNGGKVLFFMDVLYADRDSLKNTDAQVAYARDLEISDLLFKYGLRINNDLLIDSHCDKLPITVGNVGGKPQIQLLPFPYYPLAQPGSQHPIVKNMADVVMQFPNSIDTIFTEGVQQTVLLASSTTATTEPTPAQIDINRLQHEENVTKLNKKNIPLAVLSEGKFSSAYALRATQAQEDSLKSYGRDIMRQCTVSNSIILVSDAEMILNDYSDVAGPLPMGMNKFTKIQYANREFFLNCLEYLGNPNSILEARAKDYGLRLLDQKMLAEDKSTWQVINIAAPVLLVCIFGFIYQWWRKRKYTK